MVELLLSAFPKFGPFLSICWSYILVSLVWSCLRHWASVANLMSFYCSIKLRAPEGSMNLNSFWGNEETFIRVLVNEALSLIVHSLFGEPATGSHLSLPPRTGTLKPSVLSFICHLTISCLLSPLSLYITPHSHLS